MCPDSSSGRAPALRAGDLGSNLGPDANFSLNIYFEVQSPKVCVPQVNLIEKEKTLSFTRILILRRTAIIEIT